jgi:tricarballylate dehydrogenase
MPPADRSAIDPDRLHDVLVIDGGNAALCTAMTAREAGASVLLFESAPREFRGGNSATRSTCAISTNTGTGI